MSYAPERTPSERAIIYGMASQGASLAAINAALQASNARDLPESSYRSIVHDYVPQFQAHPERLVEAISTPPTWSDLKANP